MIRWWLEKGVDGFRMDVVNYISKEEGLPDGDPFVGNLMGYTGIEHYYYGPHLHEYLKEIREKAFDAYGAFSIGETPGLGIQMARLVTGEERKELDMIFSFDHLETPGHVRFEDYRYDLNAFRDNMDIWMTQYGNNCWPTVFYNNHDNPRMISKIDPEGNYRESIAVLLAVIQMTLRGTPFIYQGDEMGLGNVPFRSMEDITDVESVNKYEELLADPEIEIVVNLTPP
ncbi:MAG: alpha-amylase family glycosyl hydrolase, partial [Erysipelotrichaceae bacterium]|nr:alpha-amylase family glycosyl hydrolase [Erysipelotrichaceae bacterium]